MGKRRLITDPVWTPNDIQQLSQQILNYVDEAVRLEHVSGHTWHHAGHRNFFDGHRQYIGKLETWLAGQGLSRFVPLPKWDPATRIPVSFERVKMLPAVVQRGLGSTITNANPNLPTPGSLANLSQFQSVEALSADQALVLWHEDVHLRVGGAMAVLAVSPCAAIFWLWHAFVDDIYEDWLGLQGPIGLPWDHIGHANDVVAMAAINSKLFCATRDNSLWWRDPVGRAPDGSEVPWDHIGHANDVVAMAAINSKLFCATRDNSLWWRDPVGRAPDGSEVPWDHIGHANDVVAMAAINSKLFCATRDNSLWWRDPVGRAPDGSEVPWDHIGHANDVVAMAAINNKLFCATGDDHLWWRDPVGHDVNWDLIGHAIDVVAMDAINGKLFCATGDNSLWWRDPVR